MATPALDKDLMARITAINSASAARGANKIGGNTQAGSLLRSRLDAIEKYGSPEQASKARQVATTGKGGGGILGSGLGILTKGLDLFNYARRGVEATVEVGLEKASGRNIGKPFWQNVTNPNYGVGTILENTPGGKTMNPWVKRAIGFTGDVVLDPLTYATFGSGSAIEGAGKSAGIARLASNAARAAELSDEAKFFGRTAAEWGDLAAKAGRGGSKLSNEELQSIAKASGMSAKQARNFGYGVSFGLPFSHARTLVPYTGAIGRAVARGGEVTSAALAGTKLGKALGGEAWALKQMVRSGDARQVEIGVRTLDMIRQARGAEGYTERELFRGLNDALHAAHQAGLDPNALAEAIGSRPVKAALADQYGQVPTALVAGPGYDLLNAEQKAAVDQIGEWLDQIPDFTAKAASHGITGEGERFINHATEAGRAYNPRVMTDEFRDLTNRGAGSVPRDLSSMDRANFEKAALDVGDMVIEGDETTRIVQPGQLLDDGTKAGSQEAQIQKIVNERFGDKAVQWYKTNPYEYLPEYARGVARRTGQIKAKNYLRSFGLADKWSEWADVALTGGMKGVAIKDLHASAVEGLRSLDNEIEGLADSVASTERQMAELQARRAANDITQEEFERESAKATKAYVKKTNDLRVAQDNLEKATDVVAARAREATKARRNLTAAEKGVADSRKAVADLDTQIQEMRSAVEAMPETVQKPRDIRKLQDLVAKRDAAYAESQRLASAPERVADLYKTAANTQVVADAIRDVASQGGTFTPDTPFYGVAQDLADRMFNEPVEWLEPAQLEQLASTLEGTSKRHLDELSSLGQQYPASLDPKVLTAEAAQFDAQAREAGQAMVDATDRESFLAAKDTYEQATVAQAQRRSALTLLKQNGHVPTAASVMEAQEMAGKAAVEAQADVLATGASRQQQAAAANLTLRQNMESSLNKRGFTMGDPLTQPSPAETFFGQQVGPDLWVGADGQGRRIVTTSQADAAYAANADGLYRMLGFGQPRSTVFQANGKWYHAQDLAEGVGTVGELLATGDPAMAANLADAYSNQALTDILVGNYTWGPDDLALATDGTLYRTGAVAPGNVPPDASDVREAIDRMFYGGSSSGYAGRGANLYAWDNMLRQSDLTPGQMTSRLGDQWREMVGNAATHAWDGQQIDFTVLAVKQMGDTPEARRVGEMWNQRFTAMKQVMDDEFFADTDQFIEQVVAQGPADTLEAAFIPESHVWQPVQKKARLLNPETNQYTWFHAGRTEPDFTGPFPLRQQVNMMDQDWMDYAWGPSFTAQEQFARDWSMGAQGSMTTGEFATTPDRVLTHGVDVAPGTRSGPLGPGYDMFATDVMRRAEQERPDLFSQLRESMARQSPGMETNAAKLMDTADLIRDYGRSQGLNVAFDDAIELAGRSLVDAGEQTFPFEQLAERLNQIPVDGYKRYAANTARAMWSRTASREIREGLVTAARESLARDGDVILFQNLGDTAEGGFLHALPTNQAVFRPSNGDKLAERIAGYEAGKAVPNSARLDAELTLHQWEAERPILSDALNTSEQTLTMRQDDLANATARRAEATAARDAAQARRDVVAIQAEEARGAAYDAAIKAFQGRDAALAQGDQLTAQLAHLEGRHQELTAQLGQVGHVRNLAEAEMPAIEAAMAHSLKPGWTGFGYGYQAPKDVTDAIATLSTKFDPATGKGLGTFLKMFDKVNNWMKGWLTTSVGFQTRNLFGGMFNNWLADANVVESMVGWGTLYTKMATKGPEALTAAERAQFEIINRMGIIRSGVFSHEFTPGLQGVSWVNPMAGIKDPSKAFFMPYATRKLGENVTEPLLRGSLAYDRMAKAIEQGRIILADGTRITSWDQVTDETADAFVRAVTGGPLSDEILSDVAKYHFDYNDLSQFERSTMKRVVPFYTWTRKNVPLQMESLFTKPGKAFLRYEAIQRNLELGTPQENIVPSYFGEQQMIRLPWLFGGQRLYGTVDLPFKDIYRIADPSQFLGNVNPLIKTPIEMWAGKQFFNDIPLTPKLEPTPGSWSAIPGFNQAIKALGIGAEGPDGQMYMRQNWAYAVGQYLPFLQQARRLAPTEEKYQNRALSTFLSYLGGVAAKTNTPQDQENEVFRRADILSGTVNDLKNLGVIPQSEQSKRNQARTVRAREQQAQLNELVNSGQVAS